MTISGRDGLKWNHESIVFQLSSVNLIFHWSAIDNRINRDMSFALYKLSTFFHSQSFPQESALANNPHTWMINIQYKQEQHMNTLFCFSCHVFIKFCRLCSNHFAVQKSIDALQPLLFENQCHTSHVKKIKFMIMFWHRKKLEKGFKASSNVNFTYSLFECVFS